MNQILFIPKNNYFLKHFFKNKNKLLKLYLYLFYFFTTSCIIIIIYYISILYSRLSNINSTHILKNKYNINLLYPHSNNINIIKLSNEVSVVGTIDIPKINISYPILLYKNDNTLKKSVCYFSGPYTNKIGNLCIAGHNYKNNTMFSNLYKLNIGNSIYITDLNNQKIEYEVYNKLIINESDLSCILENNYIEITLITCDYNTNSKRLVIKAKKKA